MTDNSPSLLELAISQDATDDPIAVEREDLHRLFQTLLQGAGSFDDFELAFVEQAGESAEVDPFALRVGQWRIDMPRRLFQTTVATVTLATGMAVTGTTSAPVAVLAVVLPFLVSVERVELRGRDRLVLARLREHGVDAPDVEAAYARLPADLRDQLTLLEFADIWDRLQAAGEVPPHREGGSIERMLAFEIQAPPRSGPPPPV
jgi:hypothetical protein